MRKTGTSPVSNLHKAMQKSQAEKIRSARLLASHRRILILILALGLLLGAYYYLTDKKNISVLAALEQLGLIKPDETQEPGPQLTKDDELASGGSHISAKVQKPPVKKSSPVASVETTEKEQPDKSEYILKAVFLEKTWLRVHVDDRVTKQYLFSPGETMTWRAEKYFKLRIGNAGGLKLFLDGEPDRKRRRPETVPGR
ncbi:MAG: DUF4115 domain-containing protein [Deltaproteobacteria bacterium]|nr:DUF4115 domain-containing protein [Deltaproteobacteria bacterium]